MASASARKRRTVVAEAEQHVQYPVDGQYVAQGNETCNSIAKLFGLSAQQIVNLNKDRYKGLRPHAKLLRDTLILLPPQGECKAGAGVDVVGCSDKPADKRRRCMDAGNPQGLRQDGKWPIEVGRLMSTPVFYPTEEEMKDFYAYAQKLDRLVGHVGVCKVVPPNSWKARPHDLYSLQDSSKELEELLQVQKPIRQNAVGGKGLYANVHEVKRSMKLGDFKKAATGKDFAPPLDTQFSELSNEDIDLLEKKFWRNVLFNPPMYGADCPAPKGLRSDGGEGLFDPLTCGDWDLARLPSLLTHGIKKRVPGVNTPFLYIGMYRAAFAWHCEDMDLHSINYLHWGAPKTWYTVPATHARKMEDLACKNFPVQAAECKEFLRHKSVMIEPTIVLKANIPLTRTVQRAGEFIINFPGAYHSGFNNGYNCAESCNFATEYWIPFGVQAKPCACAAAKDSVRINISSIIKKIGVNNVKVKGEQWVQCDACSKWRLLPPYLMHLVRDDNDDLSSFECKMIEGMSCSTKQSAAVTAEEGEAWEIDGKVQLGLDPDLEQWVMCEHCNKWRRLPTGHALDADAAFVCSILPQTTCQDEEEKAEEEESGDRAWSLLDVSEGGSKMRVRGWTKEDEKRQKLSFFREELSAYCIPEGQAADCGEDVQALQALLEQVKSKWAGRWERVHQRWLALAVPLRGEGLSHSGGAGEALPLPGGAARRETAARAACVAQKLWLLSVEAEEERELVRRVRDAEKRRQKMQCALAEFSRTSEAFSEALGAAMGKATPQPRVRAPTSRPAIAAKLELDASASAHAAACHVKAEEDVDTVDRAVEVDEWRYVCVKVTMIALPSVASPMPSVQGMDEKLWSAALKMLSPTGKDVRVLRVPREPAQQQPQEVNGLGGGGGGAAGVAAAVAAVAAVAAAAAAAAAGWKEYVTGDGRKYYHHAASNSTQWDPPPVMRDAPAAGACRAAAAPAAAVGVPQFDTLHVRAVTQGKESAMLDKMLSLINSQAPAPFGVLVREVNVAVGYWHCDAIETKSRLDALLSNTAKRFVTDLLLDVLRLCFSPNPDAAATCTSTDAAMAVTRITLKALRGEEGCRRVEGLVTSSLWDRAAVQHGVEVVDMSYQGKQQRYLVVEDAEVLANIARAREEKMLREARHAEWARQQQQQLQQQVLQQLVPTFGSSNIKLVHMPQQLQDQLQQQQQMQMLQLFYQSHQMHQQLQMEGASSLHAASEQQQLEALIQQVQQRQQQEERERHARLMQMQQLPAHQNPFAWMGDLASVERVVTTASVGVKTEDS